MLLKGTEWWSGSILRLIGYGLLILLVFDLVTLFAPSHFEDVTWSLQTVGALVEKAGVPLLALALIFYGETTAQERKLLKPIAWLTMVAGVLYLTLIPWGLTAAGRINVLNNYSISNEANQRIAQIQQRRDQYAKISPDDMDRIFINMKQKKQLQGLKNTQELRIRLFSDIAKVESGVRKNALERQHNIRLELVKNATKWSLGALVSGIFFLMVGWVMIRRFKLQAVPEEDFAEN